MEISSFQIGTYQGNQTPAFVAAYASDSFTYGAERILSGDPESDHKSWHKRVTVTIEDGIITTAAFEGDNELAPTVIDGEDTGVTYNFWLTTSAGKPLRLLYSGIRINDATDSPQTIAELEQSSLLSTFNREFHQYYDKHATDQLVNNTIPRTLQVLNEDGETYTEVPLDVGSNGMLPIAQSRVRGLIAALAGKEPTISAGTILQYWRGDKTWRDLSTDVRSVVLTGLSLASELVVTAEDTVLSAIGKLQAQMNVIDAAEPPITASTVNDYWRGNKTWSNFAADVRATVLTGLSLAASTAITASDSALSALGKLQAQITLRATLASPAFTGVPTAPTAAPGTDTEQIANTAFVTAAVADAGVGTKQPLDSDLTAIAALNSATANVIASDGAGWIAKTYAQLKTALGLVKADVGLGNVDNTSDATKNAAVATLTNKTLTSPVINSPTGIVKGDVGLGNVDNTSDANKPISTAAAAAFALRVDLVETIAAARALSVHASVDFLRLGGYYSTGDGGGALYKRVASQPAHNGRFQSADGAHWELAEKTPNVRMFGAYGDGTLHTVAEWISAGIYANLAAVQAAYSFVGATTDSLDSVAFQAAANMMQSANFSGGQVGIESGRYMFNKQVTTVLSTKIVEFVGAGNSSMVDVSNMASTSAFSCAGTTHFSRMAFVGIITGQGKAVYLNGGGSSKFFRVYFNNLQQGVELDLAYAVRFHQCTWLDVGAYAIKATTTAHNLIIDGGCSFNNVAGTCIYFTSGSTDNVVIIGNTFESCNQVINMPGGSILKFEGNYVEGCTVGMFLFTAGMYSPSFRNNWLALSASFSFANLHNYTFQENHLYNQAISFDSTCVNPNVGANHIGGTSTLGIPPWNSVTFQNSWANVANFQTVGYMKDSHGWIHLRGLAFGGASGTVIFTLPSGYFTNKIHCFATAYDDGATRVSVYTDGTVVAKSLSPGNFVSLDGIKFQF